MAEAAVLFLGDWLASDAAPYLGYASKERQESVSRFRFASDKSRSLWAELFARWRIAEAAGLSPSEIVISHDEKGKPFCDGLSLSVSLSHSGPYVAVAVGQTSVGIDVERKRKISLSVSARWFRPEEHALLLSLPDEERPRAFLRFWTLKEAALKSTGEGLSGGPETVDCFALVAAANKRNANNPAGRSFLLAQEAVASVVTAGSEMPGKARVFIIERGKNGIYGDARFAEQVSVLPQEAITI